MAFVEPFGEVRGAGACSLYTLRDGDGHSLSVTDFGAGIVRLVVPAAGGPLDVALGYDGAAAYDGGARADRPYLGCVVGRVANRIRGGAFALDGEAFTVPANDGANALHGSTRGFDRRRWARVGEDSASSITFEYKSPAGEMGFPGELTARCTYTLEGGGRLRTQLEATCDAPTPVALAQHCYWNLAGHASGQTVDAHVLEVNSNAYTDTNHKLIPTGELVDVSGTPLDFRLGVAVGSRVDEAGGYDHNFVLARTRCRAGEEVRARGGGGHTAVDSRLPRVARLLAALLTPTPFRQVRRCARLSCVESGVAFELCTNAPGVQVYSGNFLDGEKGKGGAVYPTRGGIALETRTCAATMHAAAPHRRPAS